MKEDNLKNSIYHYTDIGGLNGILSKKVLRLTHYNFLNDPYEFKCQHLTSKKDISLKLLELFTDSFIPFIISFSKDSDSYPLWSNYTKFYGYNIEFDINKLEENFNLYLNTHQNDSFPNFFRNDLMNYSDDYKKELADKLIKDNKPLWEDTLNSLIKNHPEFEKKSLNEFMGMLVSNERYMKEIIDHPRFTPLSQNLAKFYNEMILFKPYTLRTEEEYRFTFIYHIQNVIKHFKFRQRDNLLVPYIEIPINIQDKSLNPILSVTLGPKNKSDLNKKSFELLKIAENINFEINESKIDLI